MSHNTFGDINTRPHSTELYDPFPEFRRPANGDDFDPLSEAEREENGLDEFTHSQTDDPRDLFSNQELEEDVSEYKYDRELFRVATSVPDEQDSSELEGGDEDPDEEDQAG
jgi:hypothetical protein